MYHHENGHDGCSPFVRIIQKANHCQEILLKSYRLHGEWKQGKGTILTPRFRCERYIDPIQATTEMGIELLTEYFKTGVGCSSVNSASSALSSIIKTSM